MERDESGDRYVEARVPRELHDRVERLFREYRGYESTSVQESLSVICDLAEQRLAADASVTDSPVSGEYTVPSAADQESVPSGGNDAMDSEHPGGHHDGSTEDGDAVRSAMDDVFPTDWAADEQRAERLRMVVKRYRSADGATRVERENTALSAVARRHGTTAEQLRRELIDGLYGSGTLPGELASEFFSEALGKVEQRLDQFESNGSTDEASPAGPQQPDSNSSGPEPAFDLGAGSVDLPEGLADEMASDGGAVQSVDERIDTLFTGPNGLTEVGIESLVDGAATECELCGETHSVIDLETTTEASDDRRVNLVCADCLPE